jgi:hypothetical protein
MPKIPEMPTYTTNNNIAENYHNDENQDVNSDNKLLIDKFRDEYKIDTSMSKSHKSIATREYIIAFLLLQNATRTMSPDDTALSNLDTEVVSTYNKIAKSQRVPKCIRNSDEQQLDTIIILAAIRIATHQI